MWLSCKTGLLIAAGLAVTVACGGTGGGTADDGGDRELADTSITAAQQVLTDSLIRKPGVVGTAIGLCDGEPCIKVYLATRDEALLEQIPGTFQGYKVDVEVTGEVTPR